MTLHTIIFRAEAALAETAPLRLTALRQVFDEAGFAWPCDHESYIASLRLPSEHEQMAHYVRRALKGRPETADLSPLITAMSRRAAKFFSELIEQGAATPRAGVRDVITAARRENIKIAIASCLSSADTQKLLKATLGSWALEEISTVCANDCVARDMQPSVSADDRCTQAYHALAAKLFARPADCLVIEGSETGARAASDCGFPVIITPTAFDYDSKGAPRTVSGASSIYAVFDDLLAFSRHYDGAWAEALTEIERDDLIAALQRLHASGFSSDAMGEDSDTMRVADMLKIKGDSVKTIEPSSTIRVLADRLKSERVGAMVVINPQGEVLGIISERDIARGVVDFAADLPLLKVSTLMTKDVITCQPEDTVAAVAKVMTQRRIRHLPVVVGGKLAGLISIGDVLKHRLDEVQLEANVLRDFALARK